MLISYVWRNIILLFYVIVIHIRVVFQPTVKLVSFKKKTKPKTKNYGWVDSCIRVCLEIVYLTETEIFFVESTVSTLKVAKILQYDSWIIPKSVMGPMNSRKINWIVAKTNFLSQCQTHTKSAMRPMNSTKKCNEIHE